MEDTVVKMILKSIDETKEAIKEQGSTLTKVQLDIADIKKDLEHVSDNQEDIADRLTALEKKRGFTIDGKTLLKLGSLLLLFGLSIVSGGVPEPVWHAIIGLFG